MSGGPAASIVVPTRDRCGVLARNLECLARLAGAAGRAELIVVDDGSVDATAAVLRALLPGMPFPARCVRGAGRGPAAARNLGIAEARGETLLFLGDDMFPVEEWLEAHLAAQARRPGHAVVGEIRWHPDLGADPFLEFLAPRGPQFDFGDLRDPEDLGFARMFASNLSIPTAVLAGDRFDERFPFAYEEMELGWRLDRRGVKVRYEPRARVLHLHPVDLRSYARRMEGTGRSSRILEAVRPELAGRVRPRAPGLQRAAGAVAAFLPPDLVPARLRPLYWRAVLGAAFCRGRAAEGSRG